MTAKQAASAEVVITDETPVRLPVSKLWALVAIVVGLLTTVWGFHQSAVASISEKVDRTATTLREERGKALQQHPTWAEIRKLREDDLKYWDGRLDRLEEKLIAEIRRAR